jgi:hypothetical protein
MDFAVLKITAINLYNAEARSALGSRNALLESFGHDSSTNEEFSREM